LSVKRDVNRVNDENKRCSIIRQHNKRIGAEPKNQGKYSYVE